MITNWFEELLSQDQRKAQRHIDPRLVVFYWNGASPAPGYLRDISATGFYLLTEERWYPGTLIDMTLQRTEKNDDGNRSAISVRAKVIRSGEDGVAIAFVFPEAEVGRRVRSIIAGGVGLADKKSLEQFLRPLWTNRPIGPGASF